MKISSIKRIGSSNRFNVFGEDNVKIGIFLDEILVTYAIKTGSEFDDSEFARIKKENDARVAFDMAVTYLETYSCTERGLKDYLKRKEFDASVAGKAVGKLREYGLLDDEKFAKNFVECNASRYGKRALAQKLREKGIKAETIENVLDEIEEEDEITGARLLAEKFVKNRQNDQKIYQKCLAYLSRKGYDYHVARMAMENLTDETEEENDRF